MAWAAPRDPALHPPSLRRGCRRPPENARTPAPACRPPYVPRPRKMSSSPARLEIQLVFGDHAVEAGRDQAGRYRPGGHIEITPWRGRPRPQYLRLRHADPDEDAEHDAQRVTADGQHPEGARFPGTRAGQTRRRAGCPRHVRLVPCGIGWLPLLGSPPPPANSRPEHTLSNFPHHHRQRPPPARPSLPGPPGPVRP